MLPVCTSTPPGRVASSSSCRLELGSPNGVMSIQRSVGRCALRSARRLLDGRQREGCKRTGARGSRGGGLFGGPIVHEPDRALEKRRQPRQVANLEVRLWHIGPPRPTSAVDP